ncbi:hypothetical protein DUNSADRAFT_16623 [Dunaliella salina]|uniref:Glycosyltransferase n=1 Tax=Dunaliella salina TaxID=3046 RepID=A0ABQ7G3C2_DUNSA|nr:hypothetical protein DUNSADRAFT_16623 [Dunaliella salina]|eukprot:KAF5829067.1 hypothetical protein DUNSADRAFT_16623 [Dunaliella salina]
MPSDQCWSMLVGCRQQGGQMPPVPCRQQGGQMPLSGPEQTLQLQEQAQQMQQQLQQQEMQQPLSTGARIRLAQEWAEDPYSFCFQGSSDPRQADLTLVTVTSHHLRPDILACIRMNRLLASLEQGARYCHFYTMDPTRAIHWSKILALKQVLMVSKNVLWLDSDAIITRFDIPLLPYFLNLTAGKDAVFSSEFDVSMLARDQLLEMRQDTLRLNTGVIFMRSTNWTLDLMDKVYKDSPRSSHWGDPFHDQHGFTDYQRRNRLDWKQHAHVVHYRYLNHWEATYRNGSLIFHSAGGAHKREKYPNTVFPKCQESNAKSKLAQRLKPYFRSPAPGSLRNVGGEPRPAFVRGAMFSSRTPFKRPFQG